MNNNLLTKNSINAYQLFSKFISCNHDILFITRNDDEAGELYKALSFFLANKNCYFFQSLDVACYDKVSPSLNISISRSRALSEISNNEQKKVIITSAENAFARLPPRRFFKENTIKLTINLLLDPQNLSYKLIENGFYKVSTVNAPGEFAQRGDIIDVSVSQNEAYRIYFDWDKISSIKILDAATQRSTNSVDNLDIGPFTELVLSQKSLACFSKNFNNELSIEADKFHYENILKGRKINGIENILPLFFEQTEGLINFLHEPKVFTNYNLEKFYHEFIAQVTLEFQKLSDTSGLIINPSKRFLSHSQLPSNLLTLPDLADKSIENFYFKCQRQTLPAIKLACDFLIDNLNKATIILSFNNEKNLENIKPFLEERNLRHQVINSYQDAKQKLVNIYLGKLDNLNIDGLIIINDSYILGEEQAKATIKISKSGQLNNFMLELNNFQPGEIVVHQDYGIAKFLGIETVKVQDFNATTKSDNSEYYKNTLEVSYIVHDYAKLLYAGDNKIYIPVENIELIKKFGEGEPQLDKLGAANWQKRKAIIKNRISDLAYRLINTSAYRLIHNNTPVTINQGEYQKFCELFPYVETHDQSKAISDIYDDLTSGKLMDRLICGDVGYGKTEVAMRATFLVLNTAQHTYDEQVLGERQAQDRSILDINNQRKQVVIISPTTVLSKQHFLSFNERFSKFNVKIAQLSRFVPSAEQKKIKEKIKNGDIDIIIGTHCLFSDNISFKNLGLIVIDEEHQFGVKQKEKLKNIKKDCHVLSLSATPIPRTLQMSLVGIKDLSIMATPPFERLPIKTFIIEEDPEIIKDAINRELSRNGKIFYVVPKIEDIDEIHQKIQKLDSNFSIKIAHGQMQPSQLDQVLTAFYRGDFDILLSTNIVQAGLDIPNANTIIIHNADLFGLGQLHQLKGRVGRRKIQGYSYFISKLDKVGSLSYRRLQIIQSATELGSGFNIASHDIDLRGYGNLLGDEQSGQIKEVGVELYQEMLKEEIDKIKHQQNQKIDEQIIDEDFTPTLNIGLPIYIPSNYINDENLKLLIYRKIAKITTEQEYNELITELLDRFGPIPPEVDNLLNIVKLKSICKVMKISDLDLGPKGLVLKFYQQAHLSKMIEFVNKHPKYSKIRQDGSIVLLKPIIEQDKFAHVTKILNTLKNFIYG
jgi:transcription-repair coupling factor (superfamily II helicase)